MVAPRADGVDGSEGWLLLALLLEGWITVAECRRGVERLAGLR